MILYCLLFRWIIFQITKPAKKSREKIIFDAFMGIPKGRPLRELLLTLRLRMGFSERLFREYGVQEEGFFPETSEGTFQEPQISGHSLRGALIRQRQRQTPINAGRIPK